ncbi:MAG: hypothetical protein IKP86_09305 [Anaerolineaceae bacterium]|nr:hypothetical protein [Anaerolineaceae bacterium]
MEKILVIGCPGSGKSTFARKLRDLTGLPLYYLDRIWHKADRTNVTAREFDDTITEIMKKDRWIIDGNYIRTMEMRMQACDTVFFLDLPVSVCLEGAAARIGTVREDLPWVETEFDPEFRQWILDFPNDQVPRIYDMLQRCGNGKNIFVFKTRKETDEWLEGLKK